MGWRDDGRVRWRRKQMGGGGCCARQGSERTGTVRAAATTCVRGGSGGVSDAGSRRYWSPLRGAGGRRGAAGAGSDRQRGQQSCRREHEILARRNALGTARFWKGSACSRREEAKGRAWRWRPAPSGTGVVHLHLSKVHTTREDGYRGGLDRITTNVNICGMPVKPSLASANRSVAWVDCSTCDGVCATGRSCDPAEAGKTPGINV